MKFDSFGNLWFALGWGGWSSVKKFKDGVSTVYPYKTLSITNYENTVWLGGYNDNGPLVVKYKDDVFTEMPIPNFGYPSNCMVKSIKSDHWGNKWIGFYNQGILIYRETGVTLTPVELSSFNANINKEVVTLTWQTATETNNRGFEVERSLDEKTFSSIGFITGNGTTANICNYTYTDDLTEKNISGTVTYRLKQIDNDGTFEYSKTVSVNKTGIPSAFVLEQNYPNPFNPSTVIKYQLPAEGNVALKVYNNIGEEVALLVNEFKQAGIYTAEFTATNLPSGIYYYHLYTDNGFSSTKKMMVVK